MTPQPATQDLFYAHQEVKKYLDYMKKSQIYFDEDTLEEILLRLPVKSLLRCRCVCKSWHQIIGTSTFIKATISNTHNLYLLTTYKKFYSMDEVDGLTDSKQLCGTKERFVIDQQYYSPGVEVYGSCNGLLCVSDSFLHVKSAIYLCNLFIRKVKKIPMIPREDFEPIKVFEPMDDDDDEPMEDAELFFGCYNDDGGLSFGYFDDDYKVIRISEFCGMYRVGVYSLSTDSWKIIYCDCDYDAFKVYSNSTSKCVDGVAYFIKYRGRLVCFDLHNERIREVNFPEDCDLDCSKLEAYGESIALVETSMEHLVKWELKFCGATNTSTWEKKFILEVYLDDINLYPIGFTADGTYLLRDYDSIHNFYLCDLDISKLEKYTGDIVSMVSSEPLAINYLVGNLVLLHEESLDPIAETERDSFIQRRQIVLRRGSIPSFFPSLDSFNWR